MRKIITFSGALVASMFLMGTSAQSVQKKKPAVGDTTVVKELQEAIVVSSRAGNKTPVAFTNIGKQEIERENTGRDIPYLLEGTPSVTVNSDAGTGIGYTGLRIRGTDPTRINITANGIPLNDAESNSIYWVNMADFAGSLQSIQVQRGVGTSTIGSGAYGGNVNMQTENISTLPYFRLDGTGGSYGTHKESAKFSTGLLGGHFGFSGRLSNISSDGYISRASARLGSYFLQGGYFSDKTSLRLITFNGKERTYHAWDYATKADIEKYGRTYNPCGKYTDSNGNRAFYKDQIDDYHQQHYQLLWTQRILPELTLNAALHYTNGLGYYEQYKTERKLYEYDLVSSLGAKSDLIRRKYSSANFYGTVFSLNYKKGRMDATFGGGWNKYDGKHYGKVLWVRNFEGDIDPQHEYYRNFAHKQDANVYGRLNYDLGSGVNVFADVQYRYVDYDMYGPSDEWNAPGDPVVFNFHNTFNFLNPKFGLFYDLTPHHQVYASVGVAHKEPTRNDYEAAVWSSTTPKSERLTDFEIGYQYVAKKFTGGINFYYMSYKDQFVLTGEQDQNGEFVARNVGDSYRRGVELSGSWKPCRYFDWDAHLTWSHNRIKNNEVRLDDTGQLFNLGNTPISYSPDLTFFNRFTFRYEGFTLALSSHYVGRQYMTNTGMKEYDDSGEKISLMLDAYFVSNLDLRYTFENIRFARNMTVGATIYNLFGAKYETTGGAYAALKSNGTGGAMAYQDAKWNSYAVFAAAAPTHFLAHLSISF